MKKWLVGLLAASLCVASAWAESVTYTVASKAVTVTAGTEPDGASAVYEQTASNSGQITKDNSMTLTLKNYNGATITGLTLSMKSNTSKGEGSLRVTCGDAVLASIENSKFNSANWNGAWSTEFVDIKPTVTATAVDGDVVIAISATESSLYCQSFTIEYTVGDPQFSVKFDKENWFKVAQGEASSVTAIPQYGVEPYTFLWSCDKASDVLTGTEATLAIPDSLEEGDYTLNCKVTDDNGEGDVINKQIGFTVEAVPEIPAGLATYTVTGKSKVEATGDVPQGSTATYSQTYGTAGQATKDNSMTLTLKGYNGMTITGLTLSMKSNKSGGAGSLSVKCGDATIASIEDSAFNVGWSDAYTQEYVDVKPAVTATTVEGDVVITIAATANSLYCQSYTVQFEAGEPGLSVSFDKANGFTVDLGSPDSITATAKNGAEPYTYVWSSDTPDLNGTGETLDIPATLAAADYTVQVEVTDAESNKASKQIGFSVVAPAVKYNVNVDPDIQNGSVTTDVPKAAEGDTVTVTATPASGYRLVEIIVNNGEVAVSGNTFVMPGKDVLVTAKFEEKPPVTGDVLTNDDVGNQSSSYVEWTATKESGAEYAGQSAGGSKDNPCIQLRTTGSNSGIVMTKSAGRDVASVTVEWGDATGADRKINIYGSADPYTSPADLYDSATQGELLGSLAKGETTLELTKAYPYIGIRSSSGALYLTSVTVEFGGAAGPSVSLSATATEVAVGTPVTITATANNFSADVEWSWTGNGTPDGATFAVDTSVAGTYEVKATATAGEETASKSVTITVKEKYAITVERVPGGSLSVEGDKTEAVEGEMVKVNATADENMKLAEITVKGETTDLSFTSSPAEFAMPAEPVTISATFEEFEAPPYYFQFETGASIAYAATEAEFDNTGSTSETVPTVAFALQRTTRGKDTGEKKTGEYALRLAPIGETNAFAYNKAAFGEAITGISFQYGIYGTTDKCDSFTVSTSEDGQDWTLLKDLTADASYELKTFESSDLPANTVFVRFDATSTVKGNTRRMCIDEIMLFTGAPSPKIVFDGETTIELEESFDLNFRLENYDGDYEWQLDGEGSIADDGHYEWTPGAVGTYTLTVRAVNGEELVARKNVTLTVTEPGPQPGEPAIQFAVITEDCVVGQPVNFQVWAIHMSDTTVSLDRFEAASGSSLTENSLTENYPDVSFTPDVAGDYRFTYSAGEGGEHRADTLTITVVSGESPLTIEPAAVEVAEGGSANVTLTLDGDVTGGFIYFYIGDLDHIVATFLGDDLDENGQMTIDVKDFGLAANDEPYTLTAAAYDSGMGPVGVTTLTVTVTGEGPQPGGLKITNVRVADGQVTLTFEGTASAVQGTDDLTANDWADVAPISGNTATIPMGKHYLRLRP